MDRLGLHCYATATGGIRGGCPLCAAIEDHDRDDAFSVVVGDRRLLFRCFRCGSDYRALAAALGINGRMPTFPPEELLRRRADANGVTASSGRICASSTLERSPHRISRRRMSTHTGICSQTSTDFVGFRSGS